MNDEKIVIEIDFKKNMRDLRLFLKEEFPEMLDRLRSCWKVRSTVWRCEFKKRETDDK